MVNLWRFYPINELSTYFFEVSMKHPIRTLAFGLAAFYGTHASAYSGELWLSQANQRFGTPPNMLAHGFLAGVVHSWNSRRESRFPDLCFSTPPDQMQIKNLMGIVRDYISDRSPDLKAPAQGIIRVALMNRFPCRDDS